MDIHKIDWSTMEWKEIRKGVEQKAFSGSGATVALHRLMPGHEPRPHSHPHEQIAYIMAGRLRFHIGEETHDIGAGGLVVIPSNVTHWGEVLGSEPVLNLDVFTPKRPEYAP
ncbi:MAG: cupin domain-containing protein [Alphaproteobacteria bacterium]|nr:MAG: cupin domain-containing protein [Alphaproteobacteria bacterium]